MPFAIFDLDQTLLPYDTQVLLCNHVLRQHGARRAYLGIFAPAAALRACKLLTTRQLKRAFLSYLWRMPRASLDALVKDFVEEAVMPALYPSVMAEVERHRAAGRTLILNTASPEFYATAIGERLGFAHTIGTPVNMNAGTQSFLPAISGPNNKYDQKLKNMRHLMPTELSLPLPGAWAYSDSTADLPLLRFVENPVAVNPDAYLRGVAEREEWKIMMPARPNPTRGKFLRDCALQSAGLFRLPAVMPRDPEPAAGV